MSRAVSRLSMRFVPSKSIEQQDLQALHRIWKRMIGFRTQLANHIRGGKRSPCLAEKSTRVGLREFTRAKINGNSDFVVGDDVGMPECGDARS
jgi:transposase